MEFRNENLAAGAFIAAVGDGAVDEVGAGRKITTAAGGAVGAFARAVSFRRRSRNFML